MFINTYNKRFPDIKIPLYQTGIVLRKEGGIVEGFPIDKSGTIRVIPGDTQYGDGIIGKEELNKIIEKQKTKRSNAEVKKAIVEVMKESEYKKGYDDGYKKGCKDTYKNLKLWLKENDL
jgi:hypothetical protein